MEDLGQRLNTSVAKRLVVALVMRVLILMEDLGQRLNTSVAKRLVEALVLTFMLLGQLAQQFLPWEITQL